MPTEQQHVQLFRNGRNQIIFIPRQFELPGDETVIRREGNRLILEAVQRPSLLSFLAQCEAGEEDFPIPDDLPLYPAKP